MAQKWILTRGEDNIRDLLPGPDPAAGDRQGAAGRGGEGTRRCRCGPTRRPGSGCGTRSGSGSAGSSASGAAGYDRRASRASPLSVVRGEPTAEDLAALTAVLAARTRASTPVPRHPAAPRAASGWLDRAALIRAPLRPGPGAWRRSLRPALTQPPPRPPQPIHYGPGAVVSCRWHAVESEHDAGRQAVPVQCGWPTRSRSTRPGCSASWPLRAIPGVEQVTADSYTRTVRTTTGGAAVIELIPQPGQGHVLLRAAVSPPRPGQRTGGRAAAGCWTPTPTRPPSTPRWPRTACSPRWSGPGPGCACRAATTGSSWPCARCSASRSRWPRPARSPAGWPPSTARTPRPAARPG